jgi:hypothetical protein
MDALALRAKLLVVMVVDRRAPHTEVHRGTIGALGHGPPCPRTRSDCRTMVAAGCPVPAPSYPARPLPPHCPFRTHTHTLKEAVCLSVCVGACFVGGCACVLCRTGKVKLASEVLERRCQPTLVQVVPKKAPAPTPLSIPYLAVCPSVSCLPVQ